MENMTSNFNKSSRIKNCTYSCTYSYSSNSIFHNAGKFILRKRSNNCRFNIRDTSDVNSLVGNVIKLYYEISFFTINISF